MSSPAGRRRRLISSLRGLVQSSSSKSAPLQDHSTTLRSREADQRTLTSSPQRSRSQADVWNAESRPGSSSKGSREAAPGSESLWDVAYVALRETSNDARQRMEKYETFLAGQLEQVQGSGKYASRLLHSAHERPLALSNEDARLREHDVQQLLGQFESTAAQSNSSFEAHLFKGGRFIEGARAWVGQAVSMSPEASTAWAVICLALPLLTNPAAADEARKSGYEEVTCLMEYYVAQESALLSEKNHETQTLSPSQKDHLIDGIIKLYESILDYQIQSVLRFQAHTLKGYLDDVLRCDTWEAMLRTIRKRHDRVKEICEVNQLTRTLASLEKMREKSEQIQSQLQQLTNVSSEILQTSKQQLNSQEEHISIAKQQQSTLDHIDAMVTTHHAKLSNREQLEEETAFVQQLARHASPNKGPVSTKNRTPQLVDGTGRWLLDHPTYIDWLQSPNDLLLISCPPGCGKSVLSKHLIDVALPAAGRDTVAYIFLDQHTLHEALCALLHQLLVARADLVCNAVVDYRTFGDAFFTRRDLLWKNISTIALCSAHGGTSIVIDALDQCADEDVASFFLEQIENDITMSVAMTTRGYSFITAPLDSQESHPQVHIIHAESEQRIMDIISEEVQHVIRQEVQKLNWPVEPKRLLENRMLDVENRTYLWVRLIFDSLRPKKFQVFLPSARDIEKLVSELPPSFDAVYNDIMDNTANRDKLIEAMSLIIVARRPLTVRELNAAMHIEASTTNLSQFRGNLPSDDIFEDVLMQWCSLFIIIQDGCVYLLHETAKEFLTCNNVAHTSRISLSWRGGISIENAHIMAAERCMHVLQLEDLVDNDDQPVLFEPSGLVFSELIRDPDDWMRPKDTGTLFPLIIYASMYWSEHIRILGDVPPQLRSAYDRLCGLAEGISRSWFGIFLQQNFPVLFATTNFCPSRLKTILGHETEVKDAVRKDKSLLEPSTEESFWDAQTHPVPLLFAAAAAKQPELIRFLVEAGAHPNDTFHLVTPLVRIIEDGDKHMLKLVPLLLEHGAQTVPPPLGLEEYPVSTALYAAVKQGCATVARVILEHERARGLPSTVSVSTFGDTPLHAVHDPETAAVLIAYGADLDAKYRSCKPIEDVPTWELRSMLLEARPGGPDPLEARLVLDLAQSTAEMMERIGQCGEERLRNGTSPLFTLSMINMPMNKPCSIRDQMVRNLLEIVDPEEINSKGQTALMVMASKGALPAVRVLLEHGARTDKEDLRGRTALHLLCPKPSGSHESSVDLEMFRLILEASKDQRHLLEHQDQDGMTVLHYASLRGEVPVVRMLLDYNCRTDVVDDAGHTPLACSILARERLGKADTIRLLIDKATTFPASARDQINILHILQPCMVEPASYQKVIAGSDVNLQNRLGETPLMILLRDSRPQELLYLQMLVDNGADVTLQDAQGHQALHRVKLLPEVGSALIEMMVQHGAHVAAQSRTGETALHSMIRALGTSRASGKLDTTAVATMVKHGADVNARRNDGATPLHLACELGLSHIAGQLREHGAEAHTMDAKERTPLHEC